MTKTKTTYTIRREMCGSMDSRPEWRGLTKREVSRFLREIVSNPAWICRVEIVNDRTGDVTEERDWWL